MNDIKYMSMEDKVMVGYYDDQHEMTFEGSETCTYCPSYKDRREYLVQLLKNRKRRRWRNRCNEKAREKRYEEKLQKNRERSMDKNNNNTDDNLGHLSAIFSEV